MHEDARMNWDLFLDFPPYSGTETRNPEPYAMTAHLTRLFTDHPASVEESYFGHMRFAAWFASRLFAAAAAALVHALLPFLFATTASSIVRQLAERTHNRGR